MANISNVSSKLVKASPANSLRHVPDPEKMVGVEKDMKTLRERLVGQTAKLEIIPIVGMGGTGKTTLARSLYNEFSYNKNGHFDSCAWATVSQDKSVRQILLALLGCLNGKPTDEMLQQTNHILGETLHKSLHRRRYLVILDDIWSSKALDDVRRFFPDDKNRSRIILTTRQNSVANYVVSKSHRMNLLNKDDSWELLRRKVCGKESLPDQLEEVGKKIANSCRGLPLAIQVIGGLLSQPQAKGSKEFWKEVADNVNSFISNEGTQFSRIFSLSYKHLPQFLKPCLLYVGAFPEDYEIRASKLIKLWIAEGFLELNGDKSLEEVAKDYLQSLVDRNLIFVHEKKSNGDAKSYRVHDLLRDLCLRRGKEKKFLNVKELGGFNIHPLDCTIHVFQSKKFTSLIRSSECIGSTKLLKVLDVLEIDFVEFPTEVLELVNLRYLALKCQSELPENISTLRNLQIAIIRVKTIGWFTLNLFDIPELRHVRFIGSEKLSPSELDKNFFHQEKLQSLSVIPLSMLKRLLGKVPNLRKLGFDCYKSEGVVDLTCFPKLEAVRCSSNMSSSGFDMHNLIFPSSIKKLTLVQCILTKSSLDMIGELSNLEVLKVQSCVSESPTWEPSEGQFLKLRSAIHSSKMVMQ